MSSLRGRRAPASEGVDALGDRHYPGIGTAAKGAVINPALKPGDWIGYIYDWSYTWPSGSNANTERPANAVATGFGLTLTTTLLPANAGNITATGTVDADIEIAVYFSQDSAAGNFNAGGVTTILTAGSTLAQVGAAIDALISSLSNFSATNTDGSVDFNLISAGVIEKNLIQIRTPATNSVPNAGGTVVTPPTSSLEPGGVNGPNSSTNGVDYWLSRSGGQGSIWYYWIDTDSQPGPDTKRNLVDFLADDAIDYDYRDDVMQQAAALGWTP